MNTNNLEQRIDQAMGNEKADLVIQNVTILNLKTGQKSVGDIAICDDKIIGVCDNYEGHEQIDGTGLFATAGFIDTHLHIESSLVTPHEFERMVLPMGTTTAFPDPHEMANVIGTDAFDFFLESASTTIMDLMINLSSCVPATPIGTSGAIINAKDIAPYVDAAHAHGLAEVMNIPAVINKDPDMMEKLALFQDGHIDGHMPGLGLDPAHGKMLNALSAAGIQTDHECSALTEAFEKQRRGINILIREGTAAKNLEALMPLITTENSFSTALCTDDFHPADIIAHGHINHLIAKAIALYDPEIHGADKDKHVMNVYRMASLAAANNFGLTDRGNIAPNKKADIVLLSNLDTCAIKHVIKDGALITNDSFASRPEVKIRGLNSVHLGKISADQLQLKPQNGNNVPVAQVEAGSLLTPGINITLDEENGHLKADIAQDVLKCAVLERHGKTNGNIGIGFVKGFGFKEGAIAASVGHDDHNITVVGTNDDDMALAANEIANMGGGYVVVKDNTVLARLALPIAGLMSDQPFETVAAEEEKIRTAAASLVPEGQKGLSQPLISLAFISLSVIPFIRICDAGITDNQGTGPTLIWDQRKP